MKIKKKKTIELEYVDGDDNPKKNYYEKFVSLPKHLNELFVWVEDDEIYDEIKDDFVKTGKYQINLGGSKRSLFELGRYLIALSSFETKNENYHEHLEEIGDLETKTECNLIIHHYNRFK